MGVLKVMLDNEEACVIYPYHAILSVSVIQRPELLYDEQEEKYYFQNDPEKLDPPFASFEFINGDNLLLCSQGAKKALFWLRFGFWINSKVDAKWIVTTTFASNLV